MKNKWFVVFTSARILVLMSLWVLVPIPATTSYLGALVANLRVLYAFLVVPCAYYNSDIFRLASVLVAGACSQDWFFFCIMSGLVFVELMVCGQNTEPAPKPPKPEMVSVGCSADPQNRPETEPRASLRKFTTDYQIELTTENVLRRLDAEYEVYRPGSDAMRRAIETPRRTPEPKNLAQDL